MSSKKAALIIVDFQEDFCFPNGSLAVKGGRELAPYFNELLTYPGFALKIATQDFHPKDHISFASQHPGKKPFTDKHTIKNPDNENETQTTFLWPDHCVEGTSGSDLIPEMHKDKLTHIITKGTDYRVEAYSAFGPPFRNPRISMTKLHGVLRDAGVTDVFVVGLAYDFCVKETATDAAELGYRTFLIEDGTRGVFPNEDAVIACRNDIKAKKVAIVSATSKEVLEMKGEN